MKTIAKSLQVFLAMALALLVAPDGFAQRKNPVAPCDHAFEGIAEAANTGQANGKLHLTLKKGEGGFTFKLYDIYNDRKEFAATRQIPAMRPNEKTLVFDRLPASTYFVQVIGKDCKQMLGGMNGFTIGTK